MDVFTEALSIVFLKVVWSVIIAVLIVLGLFMFWEGFRKWVIE